MALADILIHMDASTCCAARLDVAVRLAARSGARLTGLYVITHQYYQPAKDSAERVETEVRQLFDTMVTAAGLESRWKCVDWPVVGAGMPEIINRHAHYTDLLVVGQTAIDSGSGEIPADLPERLVLGSGRPVLVVPCAGSFGRIGEHVLVAWKAGRESIRALNDALPLLKQARRVDILAITSSGQESDESLTADICEHLARHGVKATPERMAVSTLPVGDALLNRVCEEGIDLLVMGAFAHTQQGLPVLGSVARQILQQMTVPVVLSH